MSARILVTVASKHGATAEIGDWIGEALRGEGHAVDRVEPDDVGALSGYDAVVLGSAVHVGRWLVPARRLAQRRFAELRRVPVWLFSSGPVGNPPQPADEPEDAVRIRDGLGAREHRVFPGRLAPEGLDWVERTIVGMVRASDGDFRDPDAVRRWAHEIASAMATPASPLQ